MLIRHRRLAAALVLCLALIAGAVTRSSSAIAQEGHTGPRQKVDLELVLAVDISQSMSPDEHYLQREGYVEAFRHEDVIDAVLSGPEGRIAVMYMEWAGDFEPIPLIPWTVIDSRKAALAFAERLSKEPIWGEQRTSISRALYTAADYIDSNAYSGSRRVIDVSGDGANNAGPPVATIRDEVLDRGIVINGLPILLDKPREFYDIDHLDRYYKDCVIGGPAAFIVPVFDLKHFSATVRKKLVMEIAGLEVAPDMAPIEFADAGDAPAPLLTAPGLQKVQLKLPAEKMDCMIGEKVWMNRGWGGYDDFPQRRRR